VETYLADLVNDYIHICNMVLRHGDEVTVRGLKTRELTGVTLNFDDDHGAMLPRGVNRNVSSKLAAVEALCMLGGVMRSNMVLAAVPTFTDVLVSGDDALAMQYAAYGPRIKDQLETVVRQLKTDPTTRQAMLQIWRPSDLTHQGDKPCTIVQQFLIRNGKLELHTYMRSQDVWLGLAVDAFVFTQLQESIAHFLGLVVGKYIHHVGSFHMYESDREKIEALGPHPAISKSMLTPLPHGVIVPDSYYQDATTPMDLARMILDYEWDRAVPIGQVAQINPWYVSQVHAVRKLLRV
jgi:thymidylate synthase